MSSLCKTVVTLLLSTYGIAKHETEQLGLDSTYKPGAYFEYKTVIIPKDETKFRGGEDSADGSDTLLIVADGVGGWGEMGVDPGFFSRRLTEVGVKSFFDPESRSINAQTSLKVGCKTAESEFMGSAAVVSVLIEDADHIETANLGDCGYALFEVTEEGNRLRKKFVS